MRWTPLLQDVRVDALAADDRSGFFVDHDNATVGRFDASGRAVISDAGWGAPTAIEIQPEQAVYISDEAGRVWATDPSSLSAADAVLLATRVGAVRAMAIDETGSALYAVVVNAAPGTPEVRPALDRSSVPAFPSGPLEARATPDIQPASRLIRFDPRNGHAPETMARLPRSTGVAADPDGRTVFVSTATGRSWRSTPARAGRRSWPAA